MAALRRSFRPPTLNLGSFNIPQNTPESEITEKIERIKILGITEDVINRSASNIISSNPAHIRVKDDPHVELKNNPYYIIYKELDKLLLLLKHMSGDQVKQLYAEIKNEQQIPTTTPPIKFTIIRSPLSERFIATVTELRWNEVDLLSGEKIMLYKSTGTSRGTGLVDIWMPYIGERGNGSVAKLEDDYIKALEAIKNPSEPLEHHITKLIEMITDISIYTKYMRFINKNYLIASYLLYLENIESIEIPNYTADDIKKINSQIHIQIETVFKQNPNIDYIPITTELINSALKSPQNGAGNKFFIKYLRYKSKYVALKKNNL